jgi:hypothetical protein
VARAAKDFETIRANLELDASGALSLHGQRMILMPRHFFCYIMEQVEAVAGREAFGGIYRRAGFDGAVTFCRRYLQVHGCSPREAVEGYLEEMSLRGWGRYEVLRLDPAESTLDVLLANSALASARLEGPRHEVWAAAMEGAMSFLAESLGRPRRLEGREVAPEPGDPPGACRIQVRPLEEER